MIPSIDFAHGETIDMLRDTIRQFAAAEIVSVGPDRGYPMASLLGAASSRR